MKQQSYHLLLHYRLSKQEAVEIQAAITRVVTIQHIIILFCIKALNRTGGSFSQFLELFQEVPPLVCDRTTETMDDHTYYQGLFFISYFKLGVIPTQDKPRVMQVYGDWPNKLMQHWQPPFFLKVCVRHQPFLKQQLLM